MVQSMYFTQHHHDMLMPYIKLISPGLLRLMISSHMPTVRGVTGVDISPAELLSRDISGVLMDIYRLCMLCTYMVLFEVAIYRHVASWKPCTACLQIYHQ